MWFCLQEGTESPLALLAATCSRLGAATMGPEQQDVKEQQVFSKYYHLNRKVGLWSGFDLTTQVGIMSHFYRNQALCQDFPVRHLVINTYRYPHTQDIGYYVFAQNMKKLLWQVGRQPFFDFSLAVGNCSTVTIVRLLSSVKLPVITNVLHFSSFIINQCLPAARLD